MSVFMLKIQVGGDEHEVAAERHGRAIAVVTDHGTHAARNLHAATKIAVGEMGPYLDRADRNDLPWGIHVEAAGKQAVYGEWPLLPGPPAGRPRKPTRLSRIRALWQEGDGGVAALNNAIKVIEEFAETRRAAA
jgi:hypothetical protein